MPYTVEMEGCGMSVHMVPLDWHAQQAAMNNTHTHVQSQVIQVYMVRQEEGIQLNVVANT